MDVSSNDAAFLEIDDVALPVEQEQVMPTVTLAELYLKQGLPKRAMKVYRDLLAADPENLDLRQRLYALKEQIDSDEDLARSEALERMDDGGSKSYAELLVDFLDKVRRRKDVLARRVV